MDVSEAVRIVDDYLKPNPGTINNNKLILVGHQIQRRVFGKGKIKHYIFVEEGTRNIWYKEALHSIGVVAMGFSYTKLKLHPKAIPMEHYAKLFLDEADNEWLKQNDFVISKEIICKAIWKDNNVTFESQEILGSTLQEIIEGDVKYGKMIPKNGKYFTYKIMDWKGKWISDVQITKAITLSWNKAEKVVDLEFRLAKENEYADFKVYFRNTADDSNLTKNTIMYHYYPINDFNNVNRGVCVVNTDFPFTSNGEGIPLHIFDPDHYPTPVLSTAETIDFDAVYDHEGTGHGLGLPHSPNKYTKMYGNYSGMAESMFDEDPQETVPRLEAKYPPKLMKKHHLKRWINWFKTRQDNY